MCSIIKYSTPFKIWNGTWKEKRFHICSQSFLLTSMHFKNGFVFMRCGETRTRCVWVGCCSVPNDHLKHRIHTDVIYHHLPHTQAVQLKVMFFTANPEYNILCVTMHVRWHNQCRHDAQFWQLLSHSQWYTIIHQENTATCQQDCEGKASK